MSRVKIPILILVSLLAFTLACQTVTGVISSPSPLPPTERPPTRQSPTKSTSATQPPTSSSVNGLTIGDANAPARIEVFEDFQCPACLRFSQQVEPLILKELVETGKAYYVFRHYPFLDSRSETKESQQAANASMCANEQGKFWEYHDTLFQNWNGENQGAFSDKNLIGFANDISLDMNAFNACFKEDRYRSDIETDIKEGSQMGVQGTPSVFVNGKIITPGYIPSFDDVKAAVDAAQP